ncbi:MAG: hypothetical protein JJT94_16865 [Bernardetiaceae bacterium]|nr:hypothetical protein [Bernardetiaceae bacterium]
MRKSYKAALWIICLAFMFAACDDSKPAKNGETANAGNEAEMQNEQQKDADDEKSDSPMQASVITDIIKSIPSPLEVSFLIKESGTSYLKNELNDHKKVDNYTNSYSKALNLGVYSTDLGYANIYEKNQDALLYLNSVKKLADGLNIGQFFDYHTIKKLTQSGNDMDTLLRLTTTNFEDINNELQNQGREHLSILILAGGWIEATHLIGLVYEENKDEKLREKLGEQKIVLERIMLVLDYYKNKSNIEDFINDLKELQSVYKRIKIIEERGDPIIEITDDGPVVTDTRKSTVEINDQDVAEIKSLLSSIRSKIVD